MSDGTDPTRAAPADPWLRAALQRPAGPSEAAAPVPAEAAGRAPVEPDAVTPAEPVADPVADPAVEVALPSTEPSERPRARAVRRLAVQALYVLGAEPEASPERLLEALDEPFDDEDEPEGAADHPDAAKQAAVELARAAWADHEAADAAVVAQVPAWPTLRQPPVDRAILRLAHHELVTQRAPFAVVINEAVELARAFGEDRTPGFVNAVLDAIARGAAAVQPGPGDTGAVKRATGERPASGAAEARRGQRERFNVRKAEMAAKIGPKHPRPEEGASPPRDPRPEASEEAASDVPTPADPWAAAASRRGDDPGDGSR